MAILDDIESEVASETTVVGSVETLIANLVAQVAAAGTDPVRLNAILNTLKTNDARIAALVVANTPPVPGVPATPVPPPAPAA